LEKSGPETIQGIAEVFYRYTKNGFAGSGVAWN